MNATFGRARLKDFASGEGVMAGTFRERLDEGASIPVPGDVHRALLDAGRIEDPFFDRNEDWCAWIEDREWWYRMSFDSPHRPLGPDERLRLVFNGLDTFATVWLNGEEIGSHSNMFREAVFEIGDLVRQGKTPSLFCSTARSTTSERSSPTSGVGLPSASICAKRSSASGGIGDRGSLPSGSGAPSNFAANAVPPSEAPTSTPWI